MDGLVFNSNILVPISIIVAAFMALKLLLDYRQRGQHEIQQTLRAALQTGASLPDEVLQRLARAVDPRRADLRRAILFGVMSAIVAALGWLLPLQDADGTQAFLAIAVIPLAMALTHLGFWRFWYSEG